MVAYGFLPDAVASNGPDLVLLSAMLAAVATIGHYARKLVRAVLGFLRRVEKVMVNVEKQLYPNGGASLRDAVNRIQEHLGIENVDVDAHQSDRRKDDPR